MRLYPLLLPVLCACAGTDRGAWPQPPTVFSLPSHAVADPTLPDVVEISEAPLVSAVRDGADGRVLILGLWADGRLRWSADPILGGPPYQEHHLDRERLNSALHCFGQLFDRWPGEVLEYRTEEVGHVELVCLVGGEDRRLVSWHESRELNSAVLVTEHGVERLDARPRHEVLAACDPEYRRFRVLWDDVRRLMRALAPADAPLVVEPAHVLPGPR